MNVGGLEGLCQEDGVQRLQVQLLETVVQTEVEEGRFHTVVSLVVIEYVEVLLSKACIGEKFLENELRWSIFETIIPNEALFGIDENLVTLHAKLFRHSLQDFAYYMLRSMVPQEVPRVHMVDPP